MSDTDTLANLLAEHRQHVRTGNSTTKEPWSTCLCGFKSWSMEQREAHVAAVVAESGWLAAIKAETLRDAAELIENEAHEAKSKVAERYFLGLLDAAAYLRRADNTTDRT